MILTCPQCATRYQVDAAKFPPAGRTVRCAKCGHNWHQLGPLPEPDPADEIVAEEDSPPSAPSVPVRAAEAINPLAPEALTQEPPRPAAVPAAKPARAERTAFDAPRRPGIILIAVGWLLLLAVLVGAGWALLSNRDAIVTWLPQTASVYSAAGLNVNPHGLDFTGVAYQRLSEDGQVVLVVTGKIVNRGAHELPVPPVRVALSDGQKRELYHWTFMPAAPTLKPNATQAFSTRLPNPPDATRSLEVRFARSGE